MKENGFAAIKTIIMVILQDMKKMENAIQMSVALKKKKMMKSKKNMALSKKMK